MLAQLAGCRIHWLHLCREVRPPPPQKNECPIYDTKQSDSEVLVMVELWGMQSTPSLPLLLGPLWPGVIAPDRVLSMGQIEQNVYLCYWYLNCILMQNWIVWNGTVFDIETVLTLNWIIWNRTVLTFNYV